MNRLTVIGLCMFLFLLLSFKMTKAQGSYPTIQIRFADISIPAKLCYNDTHTLTGTVAPYAPIYNSYFNTFLDGIASYLRTYHGASSNITSAIKNTTYYYLAGYLNLYNDLTSNKNTISSMLQREVQSRNTYLTPAEMGLITSYFL